MLQTNTWFFENIFRYCIGKMRCLLVVILSLHLSFTLGTGTGLIEFFISQIVANSFICSVAEVTILMRLRLHPTK
jgi:hypothetical protein